MAAPGFLPEPVNENIIRSMVITKAPHIHPTTRSIGFETCSFLPWRKPNMGLIMLPNTPATPQAAPWAQASTRGIPHQVGGHHGG